MSLREIPADDTLLNPEEPTSHKRIVPQEAQSPAGEELRCKICFETTRPLVSCCGCIGSIGHVHENCLLDWLAHCIESNGLTTIPRCEICKANLSATITVGKLEFSFKRFVKVAKDKKALLAELIFSVLAIVLAAVHLIAFLANFHLREGFTGVVLPLFVILHSARFIASQTFW